MYFNDGTSIEGFGMLEVKGLLDPIEKIKFRLTKDEKGDYWDFEEVSKITFIGFEFNKTFEYVKTSNLEKPKLLELLVDGNVKLLQFYDYNLYYNFEDGKPFPNVIENEKTRHYLIKETEEIATCIDCSILKSWAKNVANYLADCDTLVRDLKNHKYSFAQLDDAIIYYNDICVE
ncbi:hypothetical protein [Flavobacterium haoranii]|uniref:hypothetical protein n=1 Tax=Flavobacterium haoranii TaxID=683124 RepID=UPI001266AD77|nr:hypothetical protein [Flavobacterium haoranii]